MLGPGWVRLKSLDGGQAPLLLHRRPHKRTRRVALRRLSRQDLPQHAGLVIDGLENGSRSLRGGLVARRGAGRPFSARLAAGVGIERRFEHQERC